jgi:hypothetical protein
MRDAAIAPTDLNTFASRAEQIAPRDSRQRAETYADRRMDDVRFKNKQTNKSAGKTIRFCESHNRNAINILLF